MDSDKKTIGSGDRSFAVLLDDTCERLWDKKIQLSLRRLEKLEALLMGMEQELDAFLLEENKPIMSS
ncbi:MAG: hypothetical protein LBP43_02615 [Treponema sp.]|jgi:hypothetical protein|nr:hypothetical protein [Treponema sp.]